MLFEFIYWQKNDLSDGLAPFDRVLLARLERMYLDGKISRFIMFPVDVPEEELKEYSVTNYALNLARAFLKGNKDTTPELDNSGINLSNYELEMERYRKAIFIESLILNKGDVGKAAKHLLVNRKTIYRHMTVKEIDNIREKTK